jgi:hypothetical protein
MFSVVADQEGINESRSGNFMKEDHHAGTDRHYRHHSGTYGNKRSRRK